MTLLEVYYFDVHTFDLFIGAPSPWGNVLLSLVYGLKGKPEHKPDSLMESWNNSSYLATMGMSF